jgi:type I restriction enzyme S subunit
MRKAWPMVSLKEILTPVSRPERVIPEKTYHILGAHWYAKGLYTKDIRSGSEVQANQLYRIEKGNFVYNRLFAWKGSFAIATNENHGCYVSNEFPCFTVNKDIAESAYLWRYFSRASIWDEALSLSSGGTPTSRNRLKEEKLLSMQIPLPPLSEQKRIVAKIEEVGESVEKVQQLRRNVQGETALVMFSMLAKIFNDILSTVRTKQLAKDGIAEVIAGQHIMAGVYNENGKGFPYITGPADFGPQFPEIRRWTHAPKSTALTGDVLLTVKGAGVGKINLAPSCEVAIGRQLMAIRPNNNYLLKEYLFYFLFHKFEHFREIATATTVPGFKKKDVEELSVPLPALDEQGRIVAYLNNLQSKTDELKQLQSETQKGLDALMPSILDKAFKGEL